MRLNFARPKMTFTLMTAGTLALLAIPASVAAGAIAQGHRAEPSESNGILSTNARVAALVKLINDRDLQADVSKLKHVDLKIGTSGQPNSIVVIPKSKNQPCTTLEKRLHQLSFSPDGRPSTIRLTICDQQPKRSTSPCVAQK